MTGESRSILTSPKRTFGRESSSRSRHFVDLGAQAGGPAVRPRTTSVSSTSMNYLRGPGDLRVTTQPSSAVLMGI